MWPSTRTSCKRTGRPKLRRIKSSDPSIQGNQLSETKRTERDKSRRMLGIYLSPTGDDSRITSKNFNKKLTNTRWGLCHQNWPQTISGSSIALSIFPQCNAAIAVDEEALVPVQFKVIQVVFPRLHFNSEIPRSIRHHGPVQLVGLGLYNLCTEAGLEALKCFKSAIHSNFEVKNVLGINLQYTHMEWRVGE